jgi:hypothetical protein
MGFLTVYREHRALIPTQFTQCFTSLSIAKGAFRIDPAICKASTDNLCLRRMAGWSAHRAIQKNDRFNWKKVKLMSDDVPIYFTGEMVRPGSFKHLRDVEIRPMY